MHLKFKSIPTVFLLLLLLAASYSASAQKQDSIILNETFRDKPLTDFLDTLQFKYGLRVFYKPEWVKNHVVDRTLKNAPLIQALNNLLIESGLTFQYFQDDGLIIYPESTGNENRLFEAAQLLIIGNPLNKGKFKTAVLSGKVTDGQSGDPLAGAVIYPSGNYKGTTTNRDGLFSIELPPGDHKLRFIFMGFESADWNIRLIESGYEEFELYEESHAIDEVTVVGKETNLPRSQMSMVQMTSAEIKRLPSLMGETDIFKSLTMLTGVQTVSELSSGFNIRGGNTDQNLILVEGSPVFNSSHLFGFLSLINPDVVQDVRLFKGGLPARHGERVASVMEVDFKDGNTEQVQVSGGVGIINSRLAMEGPLDKKKKFTFVAGGRSSYANWILKKVPELNLARSVTHFYDASGKLTWRFDQHNRISITGYNSNDEFSTSAQSVTRYGNLLGNAQVNHRLAEQLHGELDLAHSEYAYELTDYANNNPQESYSLSNFLSYSSLGYNLRWHPHPRHKTGAGFKAVSYLTEPGKITPLEVSTRINAKVLDAEKAVEWAAFLEEEFELSQSFSISAGMRYSSFTRYGNELVYLYDESQPIHPDNVVDSIRFKNEAIKSYGGFEPRFSARYDAGTNTILKFGYQRVRQHIFQLSNNAIASPAETWKIADYHLKPLISDQIAAGIENESLLSGGMVSAEIYYKKLQNLIEYKNGAKLIMNENIETALISSDGYSYGMEISIRKDAGRLTGYAGYTWSRTMRRTNSRFEQENIRNGSYYPSVYDKPHDLSLNATYNISRRWRFTASFVYISGRPVTLPEMSYRYQDEILIWYSERNKYRMPPYHRADVSLTFDENLRRKRMWKGSWTLSVYNLYGRQNPYSIYYRKTIPGVENNYRRYSLYKLSVIGIPVPSITYNFKF